MITDTTSPRATVLVVQDEPLLIMSMVDFVEEAGCEAVVVTNAADAVRVLETRTDIRVVFADIDMRDTVVGLDLAARIRKRWPPIELLLVSTKPNRTVTLPARAILVGKPFQGRKAVAAIRQFAA